MNSVSHPLPKAQGLSQKRRQERNRAKQYLLELTEPFMLIGSQQLWLVAQDLHKSKPVSIPEWNGQGVHEPPPLGGDTQWLLQEEGHISLKVWLLVGQPYSGRWFHTQYLDSTNKFMGCFKKK